VYVLLFYLIDLAGRFICFYLLYLFSHPGSGYVVLFNKPELRELSFLFCCHTHLQC